MKLEAESIDPSPSLAVSLVRTFALLGFVGVALLIPLPNDYRALWFGAAMDLVHVPLFALLTYALVRFCWPRQAAGVMVIALVIAGGAEIVQPLVGRSASWRDLAYGAVGIGMAAAAWQRRWPWALRLGLIAALAIWPIVQVTPVMIDAFRAWRQFPTIADFDSPYSLRRWLFKETRVRLDQGEAVAELAARPKTGAGMILIPVVRDWTGYERLVLDFSFDGEPMVFLVSVRDGKKLPPELPRFDLWRRYEPGQHHVEIELADLEKGGDFPPIELHKVLSLHLETFQDQPRQVRIGRIRLEGLKTGERANVK